MENQKLNMTGLRLYYFYLVASLLINFAALVPSPIFVLAAVAVVAALGFVAICMLPGISPAYKTARTLFLVNFALSLLFIGLTLGILFYPKPFQNMTNISTILSTLKSLTSILSLCIWITIMRATADLCQSYRMEDTAAKIKKILRNLPKILIGLIGGFLILAAGTIAAPVLGIAGLLIVVGACIWFLVISLQWIIYVEQAYGQLHGQYRN